jgi:hypothetical protein
MEVKGTAIMATREFVRGKFGEEGLKKWVAALKPEARQVYGGAVLTNVWYDLRLILVEPCRVIADMFYGGDKKAYRDIGGHSADHGLKGIYRLFVKVGSPQFILSKAGSILPTYYKPCAMRGEEADKNKFRVYINEFEEYSDVIEERIAGWIECALEICGCKDVKINIPKSISKKDAVTEYLIEWSL